MNKNARNRNLRIYPAFDIPNTSSSAVGRAPPGSRATPGKNRPNYLIFQKFISYRY